MRRTRRSWMIILALAPLLLLAGAAQAQFREFSGEVEKIGGKQIHVDRMGDRVSFGKLDGTAVVGAKSKWSQIRKGDRVTVSWKMMDTPPRAYKVRVMPPRED